MNEDLAGRFFYASANSLANHQGNKYYAEGKRKLVKCQSLEAGRKEAKAIIDKLTSGNAHVGSFTLRQTAVINEAVEILRSTGVSLTEAARQFAEAHSQLAENGTIADAVKCFLEARKKAQLVPIKLPELAEKFLHHIREQKKSRRYILDMQAKLRKASESFTGLIADIHASDINRWLAEMKAVSGRTKNNYRSALSTLFSFARQEEHLPRGVQTEVEFSTRYDGRGGEIGIYTSEQLRTLLFHIEPRLMPFVAICNLPGCASTGVVSQRSNAECYGSVISSCFISLECSAESSKIFSQPSGSRNLATDRTVVFKLVRIILLPARKRAKKVFDGR